MERSLEPKRKGKERREKQLTPGTKDWYEFEPREEEDEPRTNDG